PRTRARFREQSATYRAALLGPLYCAAQALCPRTGERRLHARHRGADDLIISSLVITEIVSVLSRRVRQRTLTSGAAHRIHQTIRRSLDAAPYFRVELSPETHRRAEHPSLDADDHAPASGRCPSSRAGSLRARRLHGDVRHPTRRRRAGGWP